VKIFLDECVDWRLVPVTARDIIGHDVKTARQMGGTAVKNGELLTLAPKHFHVFVTTDRNLSFQQNLDSFQSLSSCLRRGQIAWPASGLSYQTFWRPSKALGATPQVSLYYLIILTITRNFGRRIFRTYQLARVYDELAPCARRRRSKESATSRSWHR
jgi:hypothetical protein